MGATSRTHGEKRNTREGLIGRLKRKA